jgi:hypothetical protein
MLYAGIDIHKRVFQAVVLDPDSGELSESRFEPSRERLGDWAIQWQGKVAAVAIEAATGWRWVARELQAHGFEATWSIRRGRARYAVVDGSRRPTGSTPAGSRCCSPVSCSRRARPSLPPAEIQRLRDQTRLRKAQLDGEI